MLDTNDSLGYVDIVWINSEILIVSSVSTKDGDPVIKLQKIIVENSRGVLKGTFAIQVDSVSGFPSLASMQDNIYLAFYSPQSQRINIAKINW